MTGRLFSPFALFFPLKFVPCTSGPDQHLHFYQYFEVNIPNSCCDKGSSCDGYQGWIPRIVIFNPTVPLQIENAVERNGQADKQQGAAKEKPTAEKKRHQD